MFPLTDREMKMSIVILVEIADQDLQESMKITVFHTEDRKPDVIENLMFSDVLDRYYCPD